MSKSYKSFIKEYSMGLQVPSTSYLKPIGDLFRQTFTKERKCVLDSGDLGFTVDN